MTISVKKDEEAKQLIKQYSSVSLENYLNKKMLNVNNFKRSQDIFVIMRGTKLNRIFRPKLKKAELTKRFLQ